MNTLRAVGRFCGWKNPSKCSWIALMKRRPVIPIAKLIQEPILMSPGKMYSSMRFQAPRQNIVWQGKKRNRPKTMSPARSRTGDQLRHDSFMVTCDELIMGCYYTMLLRSNKHGCFCQNIYIQIECLRFPIPKVVIHIGPCFPWYVLHELNLSSQPLWSRDSKCHFWHDTMNTVLCRFESIYGIAVLSSNLCHKLILKNATIIPWCAYSTTFLIQMSL